MVSSLTLHPMVSLVRRRIGMGLLGGALLCCHVSAQALQETEEGLRSAPTQRLSKAVDRHEGLFWAAEKALKLLSHSDKGQEMAGALDSVLVHSYHEMNHAALFDPERRGIDEARDQEALAVADMVHQWLASLSYGLVLQGKPDPSSMPLPDTGVVQRFLEKASIPSVDGFTRHCRLVGLRFLDRVGFSEAVLGRRAFLQLPNLDANWALYESGQIKMSPEVGLKGETGVEVAAVAQELQARTRRVGGAYHSLGDAVASGATASFEGNTAGSLLQVVLPAERKLSSLPKDPLPPAEPSPGMDPTNLLLGLGIFGLLGWMAKDHWKSQSSEEEEISDTRSTRSLEGIPSPVGDLPDIVEIASARTVVSESGTSSFQADALSRDGKAPSVAPGASVPSWLSAALTVPLGGRYQDLQILGSGGMGTVVAAEDRRLGRRVAVKVPPPHLASQPEFRERFLREARALARLDHPAVVRIHDVPDVAEGEVPVMIMEYVEGTDLLAYVREHGCPQVSEASQWIIQAAAGLDHVHAQGICHRDVKPANLMLSKGRVKILDFGLAAAEDHEKLTADGAMVGSLPFMPPEQLMGKQVDHLADQYALAATAFWILVGQLPFEPEDGVRTRARSVSSLRAGLPATLDEVFFRALNPQAAARYTSCSEFARVLMQAGQGVLL